jgi:glyoxylase-like metal-dependent hydrolase (beta-lactamase superfamily II)
MTRYQVGFAFMLALVHASPSPSAPAAAQTTQPGARLERIADGVYAIIHDATDEQFPSGNTGVVVGDDGVLVVDATYLPSHAKADIALIRSVTDKPVRYLVITHLHRDHNGGTSAYRDAFPGVVVVSGAQTRDFIAINRAATAKSAAAPGSPLRTALAALELRLASGTDSAGQALTPSAKADVEHRIAQRRAEVDELSALRVITPDIAVKSELDLFLGNRRVQLRNRGRAHSPDDVSVYLPTEGVLFSGDIVVQAPLPFTGATWPVEWSAVLHDIESERVTALMPGHGPVMRDMSYVRALSALIDGVTSQVATYLARGMTLDQIQQNIDVTRLRAGATVWAGSGLDNDWKTTVRALVERAWHELRGLD